MFSLISGFINWYFSTPTYSVLIVGEEKVGKTVSAPFKILNTFYKYIFDLYALDIFRAAQAYVYWSRVAFGVYFSHLRTK